jgi:hypothetical protein
MKLTPANTMHKNTLGCRLPHYTDARFDMQKVDPQADPSIIKRINDFQQLWMKLTKVAPTHPVANSMSEASVAFWERVRTIGGIVDARAYDNNYFLRMQHRVEVGLGNFFENVKGVLDLTPTTEKYKRFMERRGQGFVTEQLAQLEAAKRIDKAYKELDDVFKRYSLGGQDKSSLMWRSVEIGSEPWLLDYTINTNPQAVRMLERNRDEFIYMMDIRGITKADQAKIIDAGSDIMQVYHEVLSVSGKIGVDTEMLHGTGYMNRVFSREAENVIHTVDNRGLRVRQKFTGDMTTAFFQKNRGFVDYVPYDNEVLNYLFDRGGVFKKINKKLASDPDFALRLGGKTNVSSIDELFVAGGEPILLDAVVNMIDEDELRWLVQNGYMTKLPWETGRVYEYLQTNYKFPFEGLQEVFISDPRKAFQTYKKTLETVASERGSVWGLIDGAVNEFGIPKSMLDPDKHRGFVPLSEALTDTVRTNVIKTSAEANHVLSNIYVAPEVARIFKADLEIATSPLWLGLASDLFSATKKWSSGLVLGSTQWFGRQVIGNAGHLFSYGVSPFGYFKDCTLYMGNSVNRMIKGASGFDFADSLSTMKKFGGGTMSERDLWRLGQRKGLFSEITAFGSKSVVNKTSNNVLRSLKKSWNEFSWVLSQYPEHFGANAADRVIRAMNSDDSLLFRFISYGNNMTDNMMQFNLLKSVMSDDRLFHRLNMSNLDIVPHIKDPVEAVKWVEKHSYMFDEIPVQKDALNVVSTVIPFMSWRIKNIQQTVRFAVEHPFLFGTYLELGLEAYDEFKHERPVEWEAMTSGWIGEKDFPIPWVIPADKSASGRDEFFLFPSTNLTPMLGGVSEISGWMELLGLFGGDMPHEQKGNPYAKRQNILTKVMEEEASPLASLAASAITGKDKYGRDLEDLRKLGKRRTLFGVEVDPVLFYYATSFAPAFRNAERTAGGVARITGGDFGGVTGEAAQLDVTSGKFTPPRPSWTGAYTDQTQPTQKEPFFANGIPQGFAEILGLAPLHFDVYMQQGYTQKEIEMQLKDAKKRLSSFNYKLAVETDPVQQKRMIEEYENLLAWALHIETEWTMFNTWRKKLNLPSQRALQIIQEQDLKYSELLSPSEAEAVYKKIYDIYNTQFLKY